MEQSEEIKTAKDFLLKVSPNDMIGLRSDLNKLRLRAEVEKTMEAYCDDRTAQLRKENERLKEVIANLDNELHSRDHNDDYENSELRKEVKKITNGN